MILEQWEIIAYTITHHGKPGFCANWIDDNIELDIISGSFWKHEASSLIIFGIEWKEGAKPNPEEYKNLMEKAVRALENWKAEQL